MWGLLGRATWQSADTCIWCLAGSKFKVYLDLSITNKYMLYMIVKGNHFTIKKVFYLIYNKKKTYSRSIKKTFLVLSGRCNTSLPWFYTYCLRVSISHPDLIDSMAVVRRPIGPTTHWSDGPLVRRPIGPTAHWSDDPLVRW